MSDKLDQRIQIVASREMVVDVDEWRRHQPGLPNRSAAIRRLIEIGLRSQPLVMDLLRYLEHTGSNDPEVSDAIKELWSIIGIEG